MGGMLTGDQVFLPIRDSLFSPALRLWVAKPYFWELRTLLHSQSAWPLWPTEEEARRSETSSPTFSTPSSRMSFPGGGGPGPGSRQRRCAILRVGAAQARGQSRCDLESGLSRDTG